MVYTGLSLLITSLYVCVLVRDRSVWVRKFLWARLSLRIGAIVAVLFVQGITSSGFKDMGGPIDGIVLLGVAVLGAVGLAILVYTAQSLSRRKAD